MVRIFIIVSKHVIRLKNKLSIPNIPQILIVLHLLLGKDQGINIRHKVSDMIEFIQDDDRLREERKKAKKNKDKYVGMSSDSMGFRGSGFDSGWQDKWPNSGMKIDTQDFS